MIKVEAKSVDEIAKVVEEATADGSELSAIYAIVFTDKITTTTSDDHTP